MKPTQSLLLNKQNVQIIESEIQLALNAIGSARFIVHSNSHLDSNQVLQYFRGFDQFQPRLAFIGLIEDPLKNLKKIPTKSQLLNPHLSLKNIMPTLHFVFVLLRIFATKLQTLSKLPIHTPTIQKKTPTDGIIAQFNQLSNFRNSLQQAMLAFNVPNGCLLTMRDGSLYVGNLTQSPPFQKQTLQLPNQWILEHKNHYTTTIPYPFRPANLLNVNGSDQIVNEVIMRDNLTKLNLLKWSDVKKILEPRKLLNETFPGQIINKSSHSVWVVANGVASVLKSGFRSPTDLDCDGFRPLEESVAVSDGQNTKTLSKTGAYGWFKFPAWTEATLHDRKGGIQVETTIGFGISKFVPPNQFGTLSYSQENWGVPLASNK